MATGTERRGTGKLTRYLYRTSCFEVLLKEKFSIVAVPGPKRSRAQIAGYSHPGIRQEQFDFSLIAPSSTQGVTLEQKCWLLVIRIQRGPLGTTFA